MKLGKGINLHLGTNIWNDARGIDLRCGVNAAKIEKIETGVRVTDTDGETREFGAIMFATGRLPNTQGLITDDVGVEMGAAGEIKVDDYSQTNIPSIFALGDVTNRQPHTGGDPRGQWHLSIRSLAATRPR